MLLYQKLSTGEIAVKTALMDNFANAKLIHVRHEMFAKLQLLWVKPWQGGCLANGWNKDRRQRWQCHNVMSQTIQQKRASARVPRRISALSAFDGSVVDYHGDHGYGELGFDSGEGAWETATTSTEGSRRVNCPMPNWWGSEEK